MNNNFKGFFNDPSKIMQNMIPPRDKMLEGLLVVVGTDPLWYRKPAPRMIVSALMSKIAESMRQEQERNGKVNEDIWKAGFITTCSELLINTREQYASPEELEDYPFDEDATEDSDDET